MLIGSKNVNVYKYSTNYFASLYKYMQKVIHKNKVNILK